MNLEQQGILFYAGKSRRGTTVKKTPSSFGKGAFTVSVSLFLPFYLNICFSFELQHIALQI